MLEKEKLKPWGSHQKKVQPYNNHNVRREMPQDFRDIVKAVGRLTTGSQTIHQHFAKSQILLKLKGPYPAHLLSNNSKRRILLDDF